MITIQAKHNGNAFHQMGEIAFFLASYTILFIFHNNTLNIPENESVNYVAVVGCVRTRNKIRGRAFSIILIHSLTPRMSAKMTPGVATKPGTHIDQIKVL